MPLLSIIIPVYNTEKYIGDCLESILTQAYKDFEIILVNDGSTDSSKDICEEYVKNNTNIVLINKENGGVSSSRNAGLDASSGDYITFVDSDDILEVGSLLPLMKIIYKDNYDIVLAEASRFDQNNKKRKYSYLEQSKSYSGKEALRMILDGKNLNISLCTGIYNKECFSKLRFPPNMIFEDWYIMPDIYLNAKEIYYASIPYYLYRENSNSIMSNQKINTSIDIINVANDVINKIKANDIELYYQTLCSNVRRVWKWVGIIYLNKLQINNRKYLLKSKQFLKYYLKDMFRSGNLTFSEKIGIISFCYSMPIYCMLAKIKY